VEEIRRFGVTARRVFLKKPPSELQESFAPCGGDEQRREEGTCKATEKKR
jgi:hypothetical protein